MARALRLNEDLTEAAALGHDLGHTPFGHAGEIALRECYDPSFAHYAQSSLQESTVLGILLKAQILGNPPLNHISCLTPKANLH